MLCAVGDLIEDIVVQLHADINPDTDTTATITRRRGGSAANVAYFAAHLAGRARFVGCVGSDSTGDALISRLERSDVDVRGERRGRTGSIVVLSTHDGRRSMLTDRGDSTNLSRFDESWLDDVTTLHLPLYSFSHAPLRDAASTAARSAPSKGIVVSMDLSSVTLVDDLGVERVNEIVRTVAPDVLFCTREEAQAAAIDPGASLGVDTVVVKDGPRPVRVFGGSRAPTSHPVQALATVVDATGAGDAFAAGFLHAHGCGATLLECVQRANQLAARVVARAGATLEDE